MSSPPKTQPETWVPAGAEKEGRGPGAISEPRTGTRKPLVAMAPAEPRRRAPWLRQVRTRALNLVWALLAAALPWSWFLLRDLGAVAQLVALALPALVVAAVLGLIISLFDERRLSSVVVAVSVLLFGWVSIFGPRSTISAPAPIDPVRIASFTLDGSTLNASAIVGTLAKQRADMTIVVEPSKKQRRVLLRATRSPYAVTDGQFVVLSSMEVHALPLPKGLPEDLVLRLQIDRPNGAFIVYAVRAGTSPLDAAQNDPVGVDHLLAAARGERLPVVLAGDFGFGDRSSGYRTLTDAFRDAMRTGGRAASTAAAFPWTFLALRSEFLLTTPQWCSAAGSTFDVQGGETLGVVSGVGRCRR